MNYNKALHEIPVVAEAPKGKESTRLHWSRRAFQWGVIAILLLIPITGLFRIDPVDGAFVILDRQIWFSDFMVVVGFWVVVATGLIMLYSLAGTVFCGWACPQNTFSEWANLMTRKLLGTRAKVELNGEKMHIARAKNKVVNWVFLGLLFTAVSMAAALIPLFYFYEPSLVWAFATFQDDARLAPSLHWIYTIFVLIILLDIAFIRHFFCRFMCIYKVWQHTFKTRETLHIAYDASRADECVKCGYCVTSCFLDIDPRKTDDFDTCINCGECVTACDKLQARKNDMPGLLRFEFGERDRSNVAASRSGLTSLRGRVQWTAPFIALGLVMFVWGLMSYETHSFTVYRADTIHAERVEDYRINIAHKLYRPDVVSITVEGLPEGSYRLSRETVEFQSTGRENVNLHVDSAKLARTGLVPFLVRVRAGNGWQDVFRVHHLASKTS